MSTFNPEPMTGDAATTAPEQPERGKALWQSFGATGSIGALLSALDMLFGSNIAGDPQIGAAISGIFAVMALIGRIKGTKPITGIFRA